MSTAQHRANASKASRPRVGVAGVGQIPFRTRYPEHTFQELAFEVARAALRDAGITTDDVQGAVYGIYSDLLMRQQSSDSLVHDYLGLRGKPALRISAGASTGAFAARAAYAEIASGLSDVVLLLGVQKSGDLINPENQHRGEGTMMSESITHDVNWQHPVTPFPPAAWGLSLNAHMERYGTPTVEQLAKAALKNHRNARLNPYAQLKLDLTLGDILNSRIIAWPTTMYECCGFAECAAAMVLVSERVAGRMAKRPVWIAGVGTSVEAVLQDGDGENYGRVPAIRRSGEAAYTMAGVTKPREELDVAEVHDIFSGLEIMAYEELGLCAPGEGGRLVDEGVTERTGPLPVNPSGGRIACGHIAGVSEIFSLCEVTRQLREEAGERQVAIRRGRGLVSTVGGQSANIAAALVLERDA